MHDGGNNDPGQRIVQPPGQENIGVVELGKQYWQKLVQENQPHRGTCKYYGKKSKYGPENAFYGMVPVRRSGVHPGIRVMDQVKFPHPFYLMLDPVDQPGADEVKDHQAGQGI